MKKITTWYKFNYKTKRYEYNHYEDDWSKGNNPIGVCKNQTKLWANNLWCKQECYMDDNRKIIGEL